MSEDLKKMAVSRRKARNAIGGVRLFLDSFPGLSALVRSPVVARSGRWAAPTV